MSHHLVRNTGFPTARAVQLGMQTNGAGPLWTSVAHTQWGDIPGKAIGGQCWYSYGGKEYNASHFSFVVARRGPMTLVMNNGGGPPYNALSAGYQNDGVGHLYAAIAITDQWGTIPGKATGNSCWFGYGGKEHATSRFYWVCHR